VKQLLNDSPSTRSESYNDESSQCSGPNDGSDDLEDICASNDISNGTNINNDDDIKDIPILDSATNAAANVTTSQPLNGSNHYRYRQQNMPKIVFPKQLQQHYICQGTQIGAQGAE